ncbi:MAG: hypothetical protein ACI86X_001061 [Moritella sp.]|jgi:hypothetical protein
MTFRILFMTAFITSTIFLSACSNNQAEIDAPNATAEVTVDVNEVPYESAEKPAFSASISVVVTATVIAIDHKTRLVTLKGEEGKPVTFTAGKEVINLGQVNVGDTVTSEYVQNFSLRVLETKDPEAAAGELTVLGRAEEGDLPGMAVIDTKVEVLMVKEINLKANTFKLKNADGAVQEFTAHNPENLKKSAVGDVVVMTYTEGLAISVEEKIME